MEQLSFPKYPPSVSSDKIRIGIIGVGGRGEYLLRATVFAHPDWIESSKKAEIENPGNTNLKDFLEQEDLNVEITAVCDVYSLRLDRSKAITRGEIRSSSGRKIPAGHKKKFTNDN